MFNRIFCIDNYNAVVIVQEVPIDPDLKTIVYDFKNSLVLRCLLLPLLLLPLPLLSPAVVTAAAREPYQFKTK
ncbi:hypothetical protein [Methanimicrococcus stummii]|uniref:hypothetical protein n=1 Tax=Methanimicrococcus stummii TaxID=3028294 RepID=UPI00292DC232|nr:hypothetical protein [Methanimicrococcus sp. Es2]